MKHKVQVKHNLANYDDLFVSYISKHFFWSLDSNTIHHWEAAYKHLRNVCTTLKCSYNSFTILSSIVFSYISLHLCVSTGGVIVNNKC